MFVRVDVVVVVIRHFVTSARLARLTGSLHRCVVIVNVVVVSPSETQYFCEASDCHLHISSAQAKQQQLHKHASTSNAVF